MTVRYMELREKEAGSQVGREQAQVLSQEIDTDQGVSPIRQDLSGY